MKSTSATMSAIKAFRKAMTNRGLIPPSRIVRDGNLYRCDVRGTNGSSDGSYIFHDDQYPAGGFQNWQDSRGWQSWSYTKGRGPQTAQERLSMVAKIEAARLAAALETEKRHAAAATRAKSIWEGSSRLPKHPYLSQKKIQRHRARVHESELVIPIRNADGAFRSLQLISAMGKKRYLPGGEVRGGHFIIGKPADVICIGEGYATMATVHEATDHACVVAFDCGNLEPVAKAIRAKYPDAKLVLCADDDHKTTGNPGVTKAAAAARAVNGLVALPTFPADREDGDTDFNDLMRKSGAAAVSRCIKAAKRNLPLSIGWPEPDKSILVSERGKVPAFPLHAFSSSRKWKEWIRDTAEGAGAPIDYVALALLGGVAGIAGCGVTIRCSSTWSEPLVIWGAVVGKPSSGKSPALGTVRNLLAHIEKKLALDDEERRRKHAQDMGAAKAFSEKWEADTAAAASKGDQIPDRPIEAKLPEPFIPSQRVITDATIEAVADVVRGNPRGVVLWRDELTAFHKNMRRYSGGSDQAQWIEAWAAASLKVNRKNRPPLTLSRFAVSILGGIQPDRLAETLKEPDDGLVVRFLYAWPNPASYVPPSSRRAGDDAGALERLSWIESIAGSAENPLVIRLDKHARKCFDQFSREHHEDAQLVDGFEAGFYGKGLGYVLRLAGALALLLASERADRKPVVTESLIWRAAALWFDYFWPHARIALRAGGVSPQRRAERKVLRWIKEQKKARVGREDIRRDALGGKFTAEETDNLMASLERAGWARPVTPEPGRGRPPTAWQINPTLLKDH